MMQIYERTLGPVVDHLDSEAWHGYARELLHLMGLSPLTLFLLEKISAKDSYNNQELATSIGDVHFDNPVLVAAGWDKNGVAVRALYALGFGGVEVGSVLKRPQPGNPKPRQFMVGPGVAFNRLGFNSLGMEAVAKNLAKYQGSGIPIGVNIGKNKETPVADAAEEYAEVSKMLYQFASYFVINVSSPNTPRLRELQDKKPLTDIVQAINSVMDDEGKRKPLFVKIAPDLTYEAIDEVIEVVLLNKLTGIVATNTTNNPDIKKKYGVGDQMGGISGSDEEYRHMSTRIIAYIHNRVGKQVEIIGVGGVEDAETAYEKHAAGARVVQLVTAIRGKVFGAGALVARKINTGLRKKLKAEGMSSIREVIGTQAYKY